GAIVRAPPRASGRSKAPSVRGAALGRARRLARRAEPAAGHGTTRTALRACPGPTRPPGSLPATPAAVSARARRPAPAAAPPGVPAHSAPTAHALLRRPPVVGRAAAQAQVRGRAAAPAVLRAAPGAAGPRAVRRVGLSPGKAAAPRPRRTA